MVRPPRTQVAVALVLLVAAVAVRAIPTSDAAPKPGADAAPSPIAEPMQLLWAGGGRRLPELDALVDETRRGLWTQARRGLLALDGCPELATWLASADGQRAQRLLAELSAAESPDEAFCSLAFVLQIARHTAWDPGLFGGPEDAERLGGLLADWLEEWAEASVESALLREPALAAAVVYGRVMDVASDGNLFSSSRPSAVRARAVLGDLLGEPGRRLSAFGAALAARYPDAFSATRLHSGASVADYLEGFSAEARLWFPKLDGECDG